MRFKPATLQKRVKDAYAFFADTCPESIAKIFVTDYVKEDNERVYENVWFFSKNLYMEAKLFASTADYDFAPLHGPLEYTRVKMTDYDFKKADTKSRLSIEFTMRTKVGGDLRASGDNCDHLKGIFVEVLKPNLL